uniref:ShKT domain-containing protein n=1 Tax=Meloidogyne incognita TaxID=6306 RepID=A0A914LVM2_MELIC
MCTNGVCQSDRSKICMHASTGDDYCCTRAQGGGTGGGTGGGGTGGGTDCTDNLGDCETKADLCIVAYAYEGMYRDCKKTCYQCGVCQNLGTDCPDRQKAGYCKMELYLDLMRWQCREACNMCGDMTPPKGIPIG